MRTTAEVLAYVDTSALVKLVVDEPGSTELTVAVRDAELVASALVRTELRRAAARHPDPRVLQRVEELLRTVALVAVDNNVLDRAGRLPPVSLRSLDALHVATALSLGSALDRVFTYDARMAAAVQLQGIEVHSPERPGS